LNRSDNRQLVPGRLGVKGLRFPVKVRTKSGELQSSIATVDVQARMPSEIDWQGFNESGLMLADEKEGIDVRRFRPVLEKMQSKLGAASVKVKIKFPYFREKAAPVSGAVSSMDYDCSFSGILDTSGNWELVVGVQVPVSTVCPCSKEISEHGAHNQRGIVKLKFKPEGMIWLEDMLDLVEQSASCSLYALLEDEDEKYCTERAYDNPRFVEDLVREVALRLKVNRRIKWFLIEAENTESIHNHSAYAMIEMDNE